ncbi:MAG TPA: DinB family protein [Bacillus sp. (in: firmicutes)]|uniref:DinB family protein n=1 Tax=Bacillus litorisediminis TaxID=2922713 RepID=UPI001FABDC3E|nr:DinB family protein [Bacillus litorisediminis]HWO74799.1 DinB family protein [Bacillus sp. (in: firmicutes)]
MYQTIQGFLRSWKHEANATHRMLESLTDESLKQEVTPDHHTLGRIAWHITITIHEMMSRTGLQFEAPDDHAPVPETAREIADTYKKVNEAFIQAIQTLWTDDSLKELSDMYGEKQPNGFFLMVHFHHQIQHRGQMTVLMRQAGLKVPGVYGTAREDWSKVGMEAPAI